jgi:two-component system OmpR family response regulator
VQLRDGLSERAGRLVEQLVHGDLSRDQLLEAARNADAMNLDRSIDVQVSRLRRKIDPGADGESFIKTVRSAGYMFVAAVRRQ